MRADLFAQDIQAQKPGPRVTSGATFVIGDASLWFLTLGMLAGRVADIALEQPKVETDILRRLPRLEVRGLSFRYAEGEPWVLKDLNLVIEAHESVAIIGPSGCGKTTLLKILLGLLTPPRARCCWAACR